MKNLEEYCDALSPHCGWTGDRSYECHCGNVRSSTNVTQLADHNGSGNGLGADRADGDVRGIEDRGVQPEPAPVPGPAPRDVAVLDPKAGRARGARLRRLFDRAQQAVDDYAQASVVFPGLRQSPLAQRIASLYDALAQVEESDLD